MHLHGEEGIMLHCLFKDIGSKVKICFGPYNINGLTQSCSNVGSMFSWHPINNSNYVMYCMLYTQVT